MENKSYLALGSFVLLGIMLVSFVSAEMLVSDAGVEYDSGILDEFYKLNQSLNESFIEVIIDLENISEMENLFSTFSGNEVRDLDKWPSSPRINAKIAEEGFNKLINDSRVKAIYYDAPVHATNNEDEIKNETKDENNYSTTIKPEVREEKSKLILWILMGIIIVLVIVLILSKFKKE